MTNVTIFGKINTDVKVRNVGAYKVASFLIGVPGAGKWNKVTGKLEWGSFPVEAWGRTADTLETHCKKGTNIVISGALKHDTWVGTDGVEQERIKVVVSEFRFLPSEPEAFLSQEQAEEAVAEFDVDPFV